MTTSSSSSLLVPTLTKLDNQGPFAAVRRLILYLLQSAQNHKFKTIVILLGLYAAKKTYGIYSTFTSTIKQITGAETAPEEQKPKSESEVAMAAYISQKPQQHMLQLTIFQKTQKSIEDNITSQVMYICSTVVEKHFELKQAGNNATMQT